MVTESMSQGPSFFGSGDVMPGLDPGTGHDNLSERSCPARRYNGMDLILLISRGERIEPTTETDKLTAVRKREY